MNTSTPVQAAPLKTGDTFTLVGDHYRVVSTASETGGAVFAIVTTVTPGGGPPPHVHTREDEAFYVIDGELEFWVGGRHQVVRAGEMGYGPRNVPHRFQNSTTSPVHMLVIITPAAAGDFFAEVGTRLPKGECARPPTPEEIERLLEAAPRHGLQILPPANSNA